jgi:dihydrodipicolinate reductase
MTNITLIGAGGRMGKTLVRCIESNAVPGLKLVGAVDLWDAPDLGKPCGSRPGST